MVGVWGVSSGVPARRMVDRDGGGTIEKEELIHLLEKMDIHCTPAEVEYWLGDNDENDDGVLDFGEFCRAMRVREPTCDYAGAAGWSSLGEVKFFCWPAVARTHDQYSRCVCLL